MKAKLISLIILNCMPFGLFSQNSPLSKALKNWVKDPASEISAELRKVSDQDVKTETECQLICQALELVKSELQKPFDEKIESNIFTITALFQKVSTNEAANYLNNKGIPLLIDILSILESKQYESKSFSNCEPMILKMFALYKNKEGWNKLSECVNNNFKNDNYLWSVILNTVSEDNSKYDLIIERLNGNLSDRILGGILSGYV